MNSPLKLLILGGYGTFGGRLAQLLCNEAGLSIVLAGRSLKKAEAYCARLRGQAECTAAQFDRDGDIAGQLRLIGPDILVDASGPFQNYGENPYRVVEACLQAGVHYLDLADGSRFVQGIAGFDQQAVDAGLFVLGGVSSFPVLTAAVYRTLKKGMAVTRELKGGIAPSPYAGVGLNVIRAIAGYSGRKIEIRRHSRKEAAYPFTETRPYVVAPPGKLPLQPLTFSLVDVPDLRVLPDQYPELETVWIGAAPVPPVLHGALRCLARLVRWRLLPTLSPLAGLMYRAVNVLKWGEHRGGMFVELKGEDESGHPLVRSWHLLAEGDDGPLIPSMAAAAVILRCLHGNAPEAGARACINDLDLSDYDQMFSHRSIYTGFRIPDRLPESETLYKRILGSAWEKLPAQIRELHDLKGSKRVRGLAQIERGKGLPAALVAALFRFPPSGKDVTVEVLFTESKNRELWQRRFGDHAFSSLQYAGKGSYDRLLCERFGLLTFGLAPVLEENRLRLVIRRWNFLGLPLPLILAPYNDSYESVEDGCFHFYVHIRLPLIGDVVKYRGWLKAAD